MNPFFQKIICAVFAFIGVGEHDGVVPYQEARGFDVVLSIAPDQLLCTSVDDPVAWVKKILKSKDYYTDVYREDTKTVGCINYCIKRGMGCIADEDDMQYKQELEDRWQPHGIIYQREARIWFVGVDKDYRGRGIASQLIDAAVAKMKESWVTQVKLYVKDDNKPARALYEKKGFHSVGECKDNKVTYIRYLAVGSSQWPFYDKVSF